MPLTPFVDGPGNVASGAAVYANDQYLETLANGKEAAFSTYQRFQRAVAALQAPAAGTFVMHLGNVFAANSAVNTTNAPTWSTAMYLDPAIFLAGTRTTKLNLRVSAAVSSVAPAVTITVGLYPIVSLGGTAPSTTFIASVGTVVAGSTVAFASPGVGTFTTATSGDFNFPAANHYLLGYVTSGAAAANSAVDLIGQLSLRQV